ncbi:hypothetical protein COL5a_001029 [Colletotrichum fioriniae]|uniref:uncharacterized protein n=1 Tax=Colletotrichum fioriniae TaxID=710243 RepID=UPI00230082DF|nr:uncharacterized protein COL516b_005886 [Colletotrichum fioriniae]KAJ0304529.1 hypothetical protein COL516b_005886 [Colletotrichum fioriniae]KAJ0333325.1 hypothetical protein COL5a_001029 [Colletotrichum fioriniae]KAJ3941489.1 hypothetical protein N0V96_008199 [Colletotrichum fioriniae]
MSSRRTRDPPVDEDEDLAGNAHLLTPSVTLESSNPSLFYEPTRANLIRLRENPAVAIAWDRHTGRMKIAGSQDDVENAVFDGPY